VLATNELNKTGMEAATILKNYKSQQSVEQGFRFLKDPQFMADTLFLKSPERIEALMVVMCLCLLVYNFSQYKLRKALEDKKTTLPNQKNKEIANPTLKWIFQLMEGVAIVEIYDEISRQWQGIVTNLNLIRKKILRLFGGAALNIYRIS
jgi:transposase